jgi:hypothetical protein
MWWSGQTTSSESRGWATVVHAQEAVRRGLRATAVAGLLWVQAWSGCCQPAVWSSRGGARLQRSRRCGGGGRAGLQENRGRRLDWGRGGPASGSPTDERQGWVGRQIWVGSVWEMECMGAGLGCGRVRGLSSVGPPPVDGSYFNFCRSYYRPMKVKLTFVGWPCRRKLLIFHEFS